MKERLREVDADLLRLLHGLLEERNLTHAGERMTISQPAMSGALARLRSTSTTKLLVRSARFELTLWRSSCARRWRSRRGEPRRCWQPARVRPVLEHQAVHGEHVGVRDDRARGAADRLLAEQAPGCRGGAGPVDVGPSQFETQLMRAGPDHRPIGFDFPGRTQPVFTDHLVCVVARDNPRLAGRRAGPRRPAGDAACGRAVRRQPASRTPPLEIEMERQGVGGRRCWCRSTSLLTLPFAVSGTDMCAFVPARLARAASTCSDLVIAETP